MICDFQNFYSKLAKMDKILNMWKQRYLTLFGKKIVIHALINSLFIYNCQIEMPPTNFLPLVDRKCKEFLCGSRTAKISHHSIIGDTARGGMRYKDLQNFILSINFKFYLN